MLNPSRTLPAMIAIGVFIVLLAAGLVWWSQAWSRDAAAQESLAQCLRDVARIDPASAAREDLRRGEDRPFFTALGEGHGPARAQGMTDCAPGGPYTDNRPIPFDLTPASARGCTDAARDWVRRYNAELARLDPRIAAKYCLRDAPL